MLSVVQLAPVAKAVTTVASAYQLIVPDDAVAPKVTVPAPQRVAPVVPVMLGDGVILTVAPVEVAEQSPPEEIVTKQSPSVLVVMLCVVSPPGLHK